MNNDEIEGQSWLWNVLGRSYLSTTPELQPSSEELALGLKEAFHLLNQLADTLNTEFGRPYGPKTADLLAVQVFLVDAAQCLCPGIAIDIDLTSR